MMEQHPYDERPQQENVNQQQDYNNMQYLGNQDDEDQKIDESFGQQIKPRDSRLDLDTLPVFKSNREVGEGTLARNDSQELQTVPEDGQLA